MPHHHTKKGSRGKPGGKTKKQEFTGTITITQKGLGFIAVSGREEDFFVRPEDLNTALNGDLVRVRATGKRGRFGDREAEVVEVLERAKTRFTGVLQRSSDGAWMLIPDDRRVYVPIVVGNAKKMPLTHGYKALIEITKWEDARKSPKGDVIEVIGPSGEHETEMRSIVLSQGFDWHFPPEVMHEADEIERRKNEILESQIATRRDFRNVTTFTIDPADAKDFDDAISVRELDGGSIEIGVHIADVSAYVEKDGAIDKEAQKRGTSIYLVDRTIPMLPEVLSNDVCSLNPEEDKLAFSAVFTFDRSLTLTDTWFGETVIRSDKRFAYEEAQALLDAAQAASNRPSDAEHQPREVLDTKEGPLLRELEIADRVARQFRKTRFKEGSIAFETDEVKFVLDEKGWPVDVYRKERRETNLMIEDLMLMANKAVAEYINTRGKLPNADTVFVWRVHDLPNPEKISELGIFVKALGYEFEHENGIVTAENINSLFEQLEGRPEKEMIETATIRSMAKAIYSTKNIGHFGLAFRYYTHFTSPIRRYPDLMVHRILKSHLNGSSIQSKEFAYYERLALRSSEREVAAVEAERESIKLKQCEYMSTRIGEEFTGIITGVTDWGVFVAEEKSKAEGLARLASQQGEYFERSTHGYSMVGGSGSKYSLGDRVRIRLTSVDLERKTIDWELLSPAQ